MCYCCHTQQLRQWTVALYYIKVGPDTITQLQISWMPVSLWPGARESADGKKFSAFLFCNCCCWYNALYVLVVTVDLYIMLIRLTLVYVTTMMILLCRVVSCRVVSWHVVPLMIYNATRKSICITDTVRAWTRTTIDKVIIIVTTAIIVNKVLLLLSALLFIVYFYVYQIW